jgi:hypothetical protein
MAPFGTLPPQFTIGNTAPYQHAKHISRTFDYTSTIAPQVKHNRTHVVLLKGGNSTPKLITAATCESLNADVADGIGEQTPGHAGEFDAFADKLEG